MKVIFVVGTTASGKSELSLRLAQKFSGAIVNCDSIQVFKGLDIGSAKPSPQEFKTVPHFLFDFVETGKDITAGEYQRHFFECLEKIKDQFPVVFVVGGTGFYFQAIEKGMYSIGAADEIMKAQVEAELRETSGPERLHQELMRLDPASAEKISVNDHYRLGRAIEILRTHKKPLSEIKKEFEAQAPKFPYPLLKLGLQINKEALLPKVEKRTGKMLESGLIDEVKSLLAQGLEAWAPLASVGYYETVMHLKKEVGFLSMNELRDKIIQNTMRLAKKQRTWFRRDQDIHWLSLDSGDQNQVLEKATELVGQFLVESGG